MKNGLLFLILLMVTAISASAQRKMQEVIYLKNGSIIQNIREMQHIDSLIRVTTKEGSVYVFLPGDILKMSQEVVSKRYKEKGYLFAFEGGALSGQQSARRDGWWGNSYQPSANTFTFSVVNGYRFNQYAGVGLGIGVDTYQQGAVMPLFIRGTGYLLKSRISPTYALDAGYSFYSPVLNSKTNNNNISYDYQGGLMANIAGGVQVFLGRDVALYMMAGYRLQDYRNEVSSTPSESSVEERYLFRRMSLRLGFSF